MNPRTPIVASRGGGENSGSNGCADRSEHCKPPHGSSPSPPGVPPAAATKCPRLLAGCQPGLFRSRFRRTRAPAAGAEEGALCVLRDRRHGVGLPALFVVRQPPVGACFETKRPGLRWVGAGKYGSASA